MLPGFHFEPASASLNKSLIFDWLLFDASYCLYSSFITFETRVKVCPRVSFHLDMFFTVIFHPVTILSIKVMASSYLTSAQVSVTALLSLLKQPTFPAFSVFISQKNL